MRLIYKIILPIILIIGLSVFLAAFLSLRSIKNGLFQEEFLRFQDSVFNNKSLLSAESFNNPLSPESQNQFENFFNRVNAPAVSRFIIWDAKQTAVFSNLKSLIGYNSPNHQDILRVFKTPTSFFEIKSKDLNSPIESDIGDFLDIYVPLKINGQLLAVAEAHLVVASLTTPINSQIKTIIIIVAGGGLLMIEFILLILNAFIIKPVNKLEEVSREIGEGYFDYNLSSASKDEIGDLTRNFENMRRALKALVGNLKEERDRTTAIISSMGEGLLVINKDFKVILANPAAWLKLELPEEKIIGQDLKSFFLLLKDGQKIPNEDLPPAKTLKTGETISIDSENNYYCQLSPTKKFPIAMIAAPLRGNGITGSVIIFRDITDEKTLDESRINFVSISSHQLRTPLTAIRWLSELLLDGEAGALNKEQKDFVSKISQSVERMVKLVNLLLQIARVEMGRLTVEPAPTDLKDISQRVTASIKNILTEKSQKVEIKTDPSNIPLVPMDKETLWQIILNFLTNASRYSPTNSVISISIILKNKFIEYSVKDSGIGVPENQKNRLFEKFYRATNAVKAVPEGSGLGLFLVKSLVESWGGRVWFESEEGKGATFFFTIPLKGVKPKAGEVTLKV